MPGRPWISGALRCRTRGGSIPDTSDLRESPQPQERASAPRHTWTQRSPSGPVSMGPGPQCVMGDKIGELPPAPRSACRKPISRAEGCWSLPRPRLPGCLRNGLTDPPEEGPAPRAGFQGLPPPSPAPGLPLSSPSAGCALDQWEVWGVGVLTRRGSHPRSCLPAHSPAV